MNPGIDFFHLPSYAKSWLNPSGPHALRVCPESNSKLIPALAWALKEAAWKSLPDLLQPQRFYPHHFKILKCHANKANIEFKQGKRVLELEFMETNDGFLAYCLPDSYALYQAIPWEYAVAPNGRPMMLGMEKWVPIAISHDGPFAFLSCPVAMLEAVKLDDLKANP
jgi:phosphopantetheinyl transferase (holo-ACP synthase)